MQGKKALTRNLLAVKWKNDVYVSYNELNKKNILTDKLYKKIMNAN